MFTHCSSLTTFNFKMFALDHLVVAAKDLDEGTAFVQDLLGAPLEPGGKHTAVGTHNRLLNLGEGVYLEVITLDPDAPAPDRPRWFDMDTYEVQSRLEQGPALLHWVARAKKGSSLRDADISEEIFGRVTPMQRGDLSWLITIPDDGHLPAGGILPTLIDWGDAPHPTTKLPERGLKLVKLRGFHPELEEVKGVLEALGLEEVIELERGGVELGADIHTAKGVVTLHS